MADTSSSDGRLTVIVTLKIKPENVPRMIELWHEQNTYIDSNELPSNVKFSTFCNNEVENEFTVVQEFASKAAREEFLKKPRIQELQDKLFSEGLLDGDLERKFCTKVAGSRA